VNGVHGEFIEAVGDDISISGGVWIWAPQPGAYNLELRKWKLYSPFTNPFHTQTSTFVVQFNQGWNLFMTSHSHSVTQMQTNRLLIALEFTNSEGEQVHLFGYHNDFREETIPGGGLGN